MKKKTNVKKLIFIILAIIFIFGIGFSLYNIIVWKKENDEIDETIKEINDIVTPVEVEDDGNVEYVEPEDDTVPETDPFWQFVDMNLLYVDFSELKTINPKTVGWIQVKGTNVNLPYVQTSNNEYYLNHSFDNSYNTAGWAFLDYRNNKKELDKNNIIYAHGRKNGSMFGSLRNLLDKSWLKDKSNYVIRTSTETENTLWQIFSVYHIPTTNDYIQVKFKDNNEFKKLVDVLLKRSIYNFGTTVSEKDKILTLSTCYSKTEKLVVHAKLIKKEVRNDCKNDCIKH